MKMAPARVKNLQHTAIATNASSGEDESSQSGSQGSEDGKVKVSRMAEKMQKEVGSGSFSITLSFVC